MTGNLTPHEADDILHLLRTVVNLSKLTIRNLSKVVRILEVALTAVEYDRLYMLHLQHYKSLILEKGNYDFLSFYHTTPGKNWADGYK